MLPQRFLASYWLNVGGKISDKERTCLFAVTSVQIGCRMYSARCQCCRTQGIIKTTEFSGLYWGCLQHALNTIALNLRVFILLFISALHMPMADPQYELCIRIGTPKDFFGSSCVKVVFCLKYDRFWRILYLLFEGSYIMQRLPTCTRCKLDLVFVPGNWTGQSPLLSESAKLEMNVTWLLVIIIRM
jgi:hypothetical protein